MATTPRVAPGCQRWAGQGIPYLIEGNLHNFTFTVPFREAIH